jgi:hypothetical protein
MSAFRRTCGMGRMSTRKRRPRRCSCRLSAISPGVSRRRTFCMRRRVSTEEAGGFARLVRCPAYGHHVDGHRRAEGASRARRDDRPDRRLVLERAQRDVHVLAVAHDREEQRSADAAARVFVLLVAPGPSGVSAPSITSSFARSMPAKRNETRFGPT